MNLRNLFATTPNAGMRVFATLATMLVAAILLTNWPTYQYEIRGGPIALWYYLVPGVLVIPMLFAEPASAVRFFKEPLFWWFVVYAAAGFLWLIFAQDFMDDANRIWRLRVLAIFFFCTIALLSSDAERRSVAWVILGCVLLACAANWIDVLRPYRFVPRGMEMEHTGRGAGLFINPNVAASFIAIASVGALPLIAMRFRALLLLSAVIGIAPTLSRSGFIYAVVAVVGSIVLKLVNRRHAMLVVSGIALLGIGLVVSYDVILSASDDRNLHNLVRRLSWFEDMEDDQSVNARKYAAENAWRMFVDSPVIGGGIGATTLEILGEGPHNMYLMLLAEQGIFGLILYVSLIGFIAAGGRRLLDTAGTDQDRDIGRALLLLSAMLGVYGFFSHNVLDEAQTLFIVAFLIGAGSQAQRRFPTAAFGATRYPAHVVADAVGPRAGRPR